MTHPVYTEPVKRPSIVYDARFEGDDNDLQLLCFYKDAGGQNRSISFTCKGDNPGEICVPTAYEVTDIDRDTLVAHVRMACMIGNCIPGSHEFEEAYLNQSESNYFQTAVGDTKVASIEVIDDTYVDIGLKKGNNGDVKVIRIAYNELIYGSAGFTPETQLKIIPGAVEAQFSGYIHDPPSKTLTPAQKDDIVAYVKNLAPWV